MTLDFENDPEFKAELDRLDREDGTPVAIPLPTSPATSPLLDARGEPWVAFGFDRSIAHVRLPNDGRKYRGMRGRYWTNGWSLSVSHEVKLWLPLEGAEPRTDAFEFAAPLRCLDGVTAFGWEGTRWTTSQGPAELLVGPVIHPHPPVSLRDLDRLLRRVPAWLKDASGWLYARFVSDQEARSVFGVDLPPSLKEDECIYTDEFGDDRTEMRGCCAGAFLEWYCGMPPVELAILQPPNPHMHDYRDRLDALAAAMSGRMRKLWDSVLAGDESARRDFADIIQMQGDAGRAALLRLGLDRFRTIDGDWQS